MVAVKNMAGKCLACAIVFGSSARGPCRYWPGSHSRVKRVAPLFCIPPNATMSFYDPRVRRREYAQNR
jgi:hypothetical protein